MAKRSATQIRDLPATADTQLIALEAERAAVMSLPPDADDADDDTVDAVADEEARIIARMARTPAATLDGVIVKARVCRAIAAGKGDFGSEQDAEFWWPLLRSLLKDLQRLPLDATVSLRAVFAELLGEDAPGKKPRSNGASQVVRN